MAEDLPKPKSRKESYLAKAAGMEVAIPEPESREEQYLNAIAEGGGGGGTSNFNDLSNRPKYNGSAMTGDTNIPEVVSYSAFTGTDGTDAGTSGLVPAPLATDANKYLKSDGTWTAVSSGASYTAGDGIDITNAVISATNTGKARMLTTDDYNYPANNPTGIALWLLEPGLYYASYSSPSINIRVTNSISVTYGTFIVGHLQDTGWKTILWLDANNDGVDLYLTNATSGSAAKDLRLYTPVINNLTSQSSSNALSAQQGKVLKNLIDSLIVSGSGAPTTSTAGQVGTLYEDTTNGDLYICTDATNPYVWEEVGGGGGITELTSADYNYPENNPDRIGLWLLPDGTYKASTSVNIARNINSAASTWTSGGTYYISTTDTVNTALIITEAGSTILSKTNINTGSEISSYIIPPLVNTTGTSTTVAMSQNATTRMVYGNGSTARVQIGNSAFADGDNNIAIGPFSGAHGNSYGNTSIGYYSNIDHASNKKGCIAVGAWSGSNASASGTMDIGVNASHTDFGYNNSQYRLLTGLYDPQSDHDAATKGYVDAHGATLLTNTQFNTLLENA